MDRRALLVILVLGIGLTGCGAESNGKFPVSGQVALKGAPLKSGTIVFETTDGSQRGGASIEAGRYSIPAALGLLPGTYVVRLSAVESSKEASSDAPPGPEAMGAELTNKELIPPDFNKDSKLTHEAGAGKPTTFDVKIP